MLGTEGAKEKEQGPSVVEGPTPTLDLTPPDLYLFEKNDILVLEIIVHYI